MTRQEFAKLLDMTLLKPEADKARLAAFCEDARAVQPASVCIYPIWIRTAVKALEGSGVPVCTVAGFPTGCSMRKTKAKEVEWAVDAGASEVDFVINLGALKSGDWTVVETETRDILEAARVAGLAAGRRVITKVILECCYLTDDEKRRAADICAGLGVDFVKTSTGFGPGGATVEDVRLLRETVGPDVGVKAAGGIRTLESALAMLEAGANRLGVSAAADLVKAFEETR
jgi:deoxyribose-phosphate aldolase